MARPAIEGLRKRHPLPTSAPAWETSQTLAPGGRQDKGSPEEGRATSDGPLPPSGPPCFRPLGRGGGVSPDSWPHRVPGRHCPSPMPCRPQQRGDRHCPRPRQSSSSHVGSTSPSAQAPVSRCRRGETPPFPPGDAGPRDAGSAEAAQPPGPSTEPATLPRPSRSQLGTRASAAEAHPRAPPPHRLGDAKLGLQTGGLTVVNAGPAQRDSANRKRGGQANGQDRGQAARAVRSGDAGPAARTRRRALCHTVPAPQSLSLWLRSSVLPPETPRQGQLQPTASPWADWAEHWLRPPAEPPGPESGVAGTPPATSPGRPPLPGPASHRSAWEARLQQGIPAR